MNESNLIMYKTADGQANSALYARDGNVWLSQAQVAELFSTSKQNVSSHTINILEEKELHEESVVKDFFSTAADGKQFLQWENQHSNDCGEKVDQASRLIMRTRDAHVTLEQHK